MTRLLQRFVCFFMVGITSVVIAQENTCPVIVETALQSASELCRDTGRNQACYGHVAGTAVPQPDVTDFSFERVGDIVDVATIQNLQLSPLDVDAGAWGVALFRLQANLPNTLPGQNVTMLVFGDTEITNAATSATEQLQPSVELTAGASMNVNVRVGPSTSRAVIATISPTQQVTGTGRLPDSSWVRIEIPDQDNLSGWVSADLMITSGDIQSLKIVEPSAPNYGPMQAFYMSTGVGQTNCAEVPDSGIMVQTPQGAGAINLLINEVEIALGSTVFLQSEPGKQMTINTIEGVARVKANGKTSTAPAGSRVTVAMSPDSKPVGPPNRPEAYDKNQLGTLPVNNLERDIEIAEALDEEDIAYIIEYEYLLDAIDLDDIDLFLAFLEDAENVDGDILDYLINDLGYNVYDLAEDSEELSDFLSEELGVDFVEYYDEDDEAFGEDGSNIDGEDLDGDYGTDEADADAEYDIGDEYDDTPGYEEDPAADSEYDEYYDEEFYEEDF